MNDPMKHQNPNAVWETVRRGYGQIAKSGGSCCGGGSSCCGSSNPVSLATSMGYTQCDLNGIPEEANLGLSCGNPTALASLRPGEVVLDLGSGAGFDVFIAGPKVGTTGRVIGVDMTPEMISKARGNIPSYRERNRLDNVEFRLGEIEHLPVPDASVDVVISNCVINLSPDKPQVWREIARVLKPGGRVAVSDIALLEPLPEILLSSVEALVGCVAGAVLVEDTDAMVRDAGLTDIEFDLKSETIDRMVDWSDPVFKELARQLPPETKPSDYVTSLNVRARKPIVPKG